MIASGAWPQEAQELKNVVRNERKLPGSVHGFNVY
eukprot:COSAG06_NODE_26424_length_615_cov_0.804264_1_plen_34_part_10